MSAHAVSVEEQKRRWKALEDNDHDALRAFSALGMKSENTLISWRRGLRAKLQAAGLTEPTEAFWQSLEREQKETIPADPPQPGENLKLARAEQQNKQLRHEVDELKRQLVARDDYQRSLLGLSEPLEPIVFNTPVSGGEQGETILVMLSDLQWGEVVSLEAMDGINSYDSVIAAKRLKRAFEGIVDLATRHWPGKPPERLILGLGGDLISGDIHLELSKTNSLSSIPAVRDLVGHLSAGIDLLLRTLSCPIDVISVPGNHGRSTLKPESKNAVETSYDTLVADFLEVQHRNEKRITFYTPASGDALFSIYGWQILLTHGDKIGSRGGAGFVGPAATAARGFKKLAAEYSAMGTHLDLILIGHLHCGLELEEGFVNASLVGPSEYGRMARFRPKPATQLFLSIHPKRFVTQVRRLQVGSPDEGTIYAPRKAVNARPRYRVKAIVRAA